MDWKNRHHAFLLCWFRSLLILHSLPAHVHVNEIMAKGAGLQSMQEHRSAVFVSRNDSVMQRPPCMALGQVEGQV